MHTAKVLNAWPGQTLLNGSQFSFNNIFQKVEDLSFYLSIHSLRTFLLTTIYD